MENFHTGQIYLIVLQVGDNNGSSNKEILNRKKMVKVGTRGFEREKGKREKFG